LATPEDVAPVVRAVGIRTFALRPLAADDAGLLDQTRTIIDEIVPRYRD